VRFLRRHYPDQVRGSRAYGSPLSLLKKAPRAAILFFDRLPDYNLSGLIVKEDFITLLYASILLLVVIGVGSLQLTTPGNQPSTG
jgi:hypothetical protein